MWNLREPLCPALENVFKLGVLTNNSDPGGLKCNQMQSTVSGNPKVDS